ncbi:MAG TPA: hypothetical protein GXZ74_01485 [Tissierellia bacterium]|nr:hypothetical protein [Tissierellia bacterium]
MEKKLNIRNSLSMAGAFVAWIIGSGFATGQEVLQFFTSYGYQSFFVVAINLVGFVLIGYLLMQTGYDHRALRHFNHYTFYCGPKLGRFYNLASTGILLLLLPVLLSGAGATIEEYFGFSKPLGSAIMALLILTAYLSGFDRLIKIVSSLGPMIIGFSLVVGLITILRDFSRFSEISTYAAALRSKQTSAHWCISGLLYLGLNLFPGSTFITRLGMAGVTYREVRVGAFLGAGCLMLSVAVVNTAILLHGNVTAALDIPVLYLAGRISTVLGAVFAIVLTLGIFSSSAVIMWSICSRFSRLDRRGEIIVAASIMILGYIISLFPFGQLISTFYPIIGYIGLVFLSCVIYRGLRRPSTSKAGNSPKIP